MALEHSQEEERIVGAQLGRVPRGQWRVARLCHLGLPMVIENHPRLEGGRPFPTLFWLTCPLLHKRASRLEAEGFMARLGHRAAEDLGARARLEQALLRYRERRDRHQVVSDSGAPPGGGPARIKCLHAHLAHELADPPNPVGALTLAACGWPDCRSSCVGESR
jgi:hypothetical protein